MSTRESQGSQEFADGTWKLTLRGFPGWRVGVGSYLVHPLDPELAHQDLQSGHEWNGQEDPHDAEDIIQLLNTDASISYVAANPPPSGEVELVPTPEFVERLEQEAGDADGPREDFRRSLVRSFVYGDVS